LVRQKGTVNALLRYPAVVCLALTLAAPAMGETVKDRAGAVRGDRAAMQDNARWHYNDVDRGFAEARRTGKPLMVVLRCVPCLACMGIDASVLTSSQLAPLLDQFVCVRLINANDLDLDLFQFDYDLSFSAVFFNADRTIYGRFGSWRHQKNSQDKDVAGFQRALEGALALHREYPANKASLAGKQGADSPFNSPLEIPGLAGKYERTLDWEGKVVASCVHCHQIGDALRTFHRSDGKPIPTRLIYPQPAPEVIGLTLEPDRAATVAAVAPASPAAEAGLKPGDQIQTLAGQTLVSSADVSWVLHRAPDAGSLPVRVSRDGQEKSLDLVLPADWRYKSDISGRVGTWGMRAMALGGLLLVDLPEDERRKRGLSSDEMALLVSHAGEYGIHAAAKKAGFAKGDVLVELDGQITRITESELIGRVLRDHRPGEKLAATVLRGDERVQLLLPTQ
jgi:hypothetical protein